MINMRQSPGVGSMPIGRLLLVTDVILQRVGRARSLSCKRLFIRGFVVLGF